jgi:uncharacterized protein DUF1761
MGMKRVNFVALAVLTAVAFVASSIWYSPLLFGRQFLALSGATASAHPSPVNALFELLRTFVLAFVIAHPVSRWANCIEDSRRCFLTSWVLFKVDIRDSRMVSDQAIYLHLPAPLRPSLPAVKAIANVIDAHSPVCHSMAEVAGRCCDNAWCIRRSGPLTARSGFSSRTRSPPHCRWEL